jgi:hypothetical protein
MINDWFVVRDGLIGAARLPSLAQPRQRISAAELLLLLTCGAAAAASAAFVKLSLGIPGSSIVLTALPMALGMSLAPRRLAGSVMSAGALGASVLLMQTAGARFGSGAFASLLLLGPMMDVALRITYGCALPRLRFARAQTGWRVYAALVLAGIGANLMALASRAAPKLLGLDLPGTRPFDSWWLQASVTYTLSGVVAGLLGALCWFHFNDRAARGPEA